jgi:hypothetical protein
MHDSNKVTKNDHNSDDSFVIAIDDDNDNGIPLITTMCLMDLLR